MTGFRWGGEAGWGGLGALGIMGAWCVYRCWKRPWGWGVVLLLAHASVDFPLQTPALHFAWAMIAGQLGAASEERNRYRGILRHRMGTQRDNTPD